MTFNSSVCFYNSRNTVNSSCRQAGKSRKRSNDNRCCSLHAES